VRPTLDEAKGGDRRCQTPPHFPRGKNCIALQNPWSAPLTWRGDAVYLAPWRWPRHEIAVIELDLG